MNLFCLLLCFSQQTKQIFCLFFGRIYGAPKLLSVLSDLKYPPQKASDVDPWRLLYIINWSRLRYLYSSRSLKKCFANFFLSYLFCYNLQPIFFIVTCIVSILVPYQMSDATLVPARHCLSFFLYCGEIFWYSNFLKCACSLPYVTF